MISVGAYMRRKVISVLDSKTTFKLLEKTSFCGYKVTPDKNVYVRSSQYSTDKQKTELTKSEGTTGEVSTTFETGNKT